VQRSMHCDKPTEPVWSNLKRSLANLTKQNIDQLIALVKTRLRRMQYRPGLLNGFLAKTRLDLSNPPPLKIISVLSLPHVKGLYGIARRSGSAGLMPVPSRASAQTGRVKPIPER
jgi:hypothetical protein